MNVIDYQAWPCINAMLENLLSARTTFQPESRIEAGRQVADLPTRSRWKSHSSTPYFPSEGMNRKQTIPVQSFWQS
jgi:hypothetical protein